MRHHVIARTRRFASTAAATLAILTATPIAFAQSGSPGNPSGGQAGGQDGGRQGGDGQGNRRGGGQNGGGQGGAGRTGRGFPGGGGGMADIREQLEPDFIRRDVPIFIQQLQLDSAQGLVLETLMGDYEESYQTASTEVQTEIRDLGRQVFSSMVSPEMRERMMTVGQEVQEDLRRLSEERGAPLSEEERRTFFRERMQQIQQQMAAERQAQGNDEMKRLMGDMFTRFEQWRVQKDSMRKDFVDGLKATLSEDQLALWPAFERFLNREKTLPKSRLMGEGVNLILVLDELELPAPAFEKVEPLLDQYEVRLDESLRARNDYLFESTAKLFKALEQGDADEANRIIERQVKHRTAVRDVNDEFRTTFVAALGEAPEAKMLESAILAEAYERVYRTTSTRRAFDAALSMEGLDPLVRDGVVNLEQGYGVELTDMNRDLYETIRKEEPSRTTRDAQRFVGFVTAAMSGDFSAMGGGMGGFGGMFGRGEDGPDPVREGFDKREKLEDGYLERLKLLLTPEQFATLPKPERGGRGGAGGGPGGGMTAMLDRLPADQKEAILKAADKNGNGQIDDDERGDAFRAMREIGGFGGRGGEQGGGQGGGGQGGQGGGGRGQGGGGRGQGGGQGGNAGN